MRDKSTQPRLDITKVSPDLYKAMLSLENYIEASGLERKLLDLVKIRASQINGCAYCIIMHTNDARKHVKATSGCICSTPGARHQSTAHASVPPSPGPKR
jgi:AhpD family alkylhydroperoxidase